MEKTGENVQMKMPVQVWMEANQEYWDQMMKASAGANWEDLFMPFQNGAMKRMKARWEATSRICQRYAAACYDPDTMKSLFNGFGVLPDVFMKMNQSYWNAGQEMMVSWMKSMENYEDIFRLMSIKAGLYPETNGNVKKEGERESEQGTV